MKPFTIFEKIALLPLAILAIISIPILIAGALTVYIITEMKKWIGINDK